MQFPDKNSPHTQINISKQIRTRLLENVCCDSPVPYYFCSWSCRGKEKFFKFYCRSFSPRGLKKNISTCQKKQDSGYYIPQVWGEERVGVLRGRSEGFWNRRQGKSLWVLPKGQALGHRKLGSMTSKKSPLLGFTLFLSSLCQLPGTSFLCSHRWMMITSPTEYSCIAVRIKWNDYCEVTWKL